MRYRIHAYAVFVPLAFALVAPSTNEAQQLRNTPVAKQIVTMDNMRALVPSLVALGWDDFFLTNRNEIGLSPSQAQELLWLRLAFAGATEEIAERLKEAKLALYEELDRDQVLAREVEERVRWVAVLRGELCALHFRYLLRAINVLDHEQHQKLSALLKLSEGWQNPKALKGGARASMGRRSPLPQTSACVSVSLAGLQ